MRETLRLIASVYDRARHEPARLDVVRCYAALRVELWQQYRQLLCAVDVEFTTVDPYRTSAAMHADIDRGRLKVYTGADLPVDHPMTARMPNGETLNSVFRAVHDAVAHYPTRLGFGPRGESLAFRAHAYLLGPDAIRAVATETLAQNAWFNYGPYSALPVSGRPFAPQKATLLPDDLINAALSGD